MAFFNCITAFSGQSLAEQGTLFVRYFPKGEPAVESIMVATNAELKKRLAGNVNSDNTYYWPNVKPGDVSCHLSLSVEHIDGDIYIGYVIWISQDINLKYDVKTPAIVQAHTEGDAAMLLADAILKAARHVNGK